MGVLNISYLFRFRERESFHYEIAIDDTTLAYIPKKNATKPDWAKLEFHSCGQCPLKKERDVYCPIAANLSELITSFGNAKSYEKVSVVVHTQERTYFKDTDVQTGLLSMFGLIMASSDCPTMSFLRPLVKFHLPFATPEETLFRIVSMYFLRHYFSKKEKQNFDNILDELKGHYQVVGEVNRSMLQRIRQVGCGDADKNAIVGLDLFVQMFSFEYAEKLDSLAYLFNKDQQESEQEQNQENQKQEKDKEKT